MFKVVTVVVLSLLKDDKRNTSNTVSTALRQAQCDIAQPDSNLKHSTSNY